MVASLLLRGITKRFSPAHGVFAIDLEVTDGEAVSLLGPSGCGKTTLLRIVAGLMRPEAGTITVTGQDVTTAPAHRRDIGMVFQTWALFGHLSVMRNVEFGLAMRRVPSAERRRRAGAMLDLVGLAAYADRRPGQLSGGQQQRVALARALAIRPRLLLLDEPMSSLDHNTRVELRRELRKLQQSLGVAAITVTHDYSEALALADRTVLMHGGRIVEQAQTRALFDRPTTDYAARFLGLHNVLPAVETAVEDRCITVAIDGALRGRVARDPGAAGPLPGDTVSLCFDHWSASLEAAPDAVPVTIVDCIAEHGCTRVVVRCDGGAEAISVQIPGLRTAPAGSASMLRIDWKRVWILAPHKTEIDASCCE
jgi:ABC-type Fe3+/spermidine/putrescine transport system ATPase subunit